MKGNSVSCTFPEGGTSLFAPCIPECGHSIQHTWVNTRRYTSIDFTYIGLANTPAGPVIIHIERYQTKHGDIKADMPAIEALETILPWDTHKTKAVRTTCYHLKEDTYQVFERRVKTSVWESSVFIRSKEDSSVEHPSCERREL